MAFWMVRAGKQGQHENLALEKGLVAIGWDDVPDLSTAKSRAEVRKVCEAAYPDASKSRISNYTGQLWGLRGRMEEGDIVALPLKTRSAVALGKVTGPYEYHPEHSEGAKHTRPVEWIRDDIPRTDFAQDMLYSLGAFITVCRIQRNDAEKRIAAMLLGGPDPYLAARPTPPDEGDGDEETSLDLEEYAQDQIRTHIGASFKGHELTSLVQSLLEAQGYHTFMSPPGPDGGVDIVAGGGPMGFERPRLCVQVKSGATPEDVSTLRELQGVVKNFGAEQGLLVSWSGFKKSVYSEARTLYFEIRLWDADKLVQALLDHYEQLPEEIQAELPLKRIWVLVPEEE